MSKRYKIEDCFQITNRGTAVVISETTELPIGKALNAVIVYPDGTSFNAEAFKEWLLRRTPEPLEKEAFLLMGIDKHSIVDGCWIEFHEL